MDDNYATYVRAHSAVSNAGLIRRQVCLQTNHERALMYVITIMDVPMNLVSVEELLSVEGRLLLKKNSFDLPKHFDNEVRLITSGKFIRNFLVTCRLSAEFVPASSH